MSTTVTDMVTLPSLQRVRLLRAYSQRDLAKAAGLSPRTIVSAEQGSSMSLRTLRKLAQVLNVEPSELTAEPESSD
jgi:transcriptional regulator with XRE-family HTH domain